MQKNIIYSNEKTKEIINIVKKSQMKISNKYLILDILEDGRLNAIIKKITNDKIFISKSPILSKGYLTGYEQFISILDNFISYILNFVDSPGLIKEIIIKCLLDSDILLSKKYFFDTENIKYYKYNFNILIGRAFYKNLIKLKKELKEELKKINLDIETVNINDANDINYITGIINELVFINRNDYKILSLFTDIDNSKYNLYLDWYKMLLTKYIMNIDFIKQYRNYKKNLY